VIVSEDQRAICLFQEIMTPTSEMICVRMLKEPTNVTLANEKEFIAMFHDKYQSPVVGQHRKTFRIATCRVDFGS